MPTFRSLAEVVLIVDDMEQALSFYRDTLGLPLFSPPDLVRNLETGLERALVEGPSTLAHWSPDGSLIAYARDRSWDNGIFVVESDGSSPRRLTQKGGWPTWWPDGSRIAYLDFGDDGNQIVPTVDLQGRLRDQLDLTFRGGNKPIDISPDLEIAMSNEITFDYQIWLLH